VSSLIDESDRLGAPGLFTVLFDQNDGTSRIWMIHLAPPPGLHIGLHRHSGDEIWRVRRGKIRLTLEGRHIDCAAGQIVVVPPNVSHGMAVVDDDTEAEVIGEIGMGEWVTVIEPDGTTREVEVHVPMMPWHRQPPAGASPTAIEEHLAMMESTAHLL
jgi:quercetin dioxygenase-like cupin family protein